MKKLKKLFKFLDKPFLWFALMLIVGLIATESAYESLPAAFVFLGAVIVFLYERKRRHNQA